jgi:hypothetical protein
LKRGGESYCGDSVSGEINARKKILTGGVHLSARGKEKKRKEKEYRFR